MAKQLIATSTSPSLDRRDELEDREERPVEPALHWRIRQRAQEIAERRGSNPGDHFEDWLQAEREIIDEMEEREGKVGG